MKSVISLLLLVLSLLPSLGKAADINLAIESFQQLCHHHKNINSLSGHFQEYRIYAETFLQSSKEAALQTNFVRGSTMLEQLIDDKHFHQVLRECYPDSSEQRMHVIYYLMAADIGGKVIAGAGLVVTGAILARVGSTIAAYYGINTTRVSMAMLSAYVIGLTYKEYENYQNTFHPSKHLKEVVDKKLIEGDHELDQEIKDFQDLARQNPQDPEIKKQLQVFLDLKAKFQKALAHS